MIVNYVNIFGDGLGNGGSRLSRNEDFYETDEDCIQDYEVLDPLGDGYGCLGSGNHLYPRNKGDGYGDG